MAADSRHAVRQAGDYDRAGTVHAHLLEDIDNRFTATAVRWQLSVCDTSAAHHYCHRTRQTPFQA